MSLAQISQGASSFTQQKLDGLRSSNVDRRQVGRIRPAVEIGGREGLQDDRRNQ